MNVSKSLIDAIKGDEDLRLKPYYDSVHKLSIGWGRNLQDCGIRADEAQLMFQNDLNQAINELEQHSWFTSQPNGVQEALINMNFNLGISKLIEFKKMIQYLSVKNYKEASREALNSLWARQIGDRAIRIARIIEEGV